MTNGEAIESFKYSNKQAKLRLEVEKMRMDNDEIKELEFYIERDEMAIKALEQEPCDTDTCKVAKAYMNEWDKPNNKDIIQLPPVNPQPKTGHWILTDDDFVYCSECEDSYYERPIDASWYYCPHCGAKMESGV